MAAVRCTEWPTFYILLGSWWPVALDLDARRPRRLRIVQLELLPAGGSGCH